MAAASPGFVSPLTLFGVFRFCYTIFMVSLGSFFLVHGSLDYEDDGVDDDICRSLNMRA